MKLLTLLAVTTAISGVCAAPAMAQNSPAPAPAPDAEPEAPHASGFYAGAGINLYFLDRDYAAGGMPIVFEDQPSPGAFMGRLGYAFNENIAIEVEAGIGGARSQFTTSGGGSDGEIGVDTAAGASIVLSLPMGENAYVMAKAGYATATVSREYLGFDFGDITVNGATFGAGAGFRSGSLDYRLEYSFMSGGDSGDGGILGMSIINHF